MNKSISYLIEAALEKEAVLMASQSITDKLERIAKELAKMVADDIIPLGDSMRDLFGADKASAFETMVSEKINGMLEMVRTSRNDISDQIDALKSGEPMNDLNNADDDMFGGDDAAAPQGDAGAEMGGEDAGFGDEAAPAPHGDDFAGDDDMGDLDAAFGDSDMGGAAGRPQKESAAPRGKKLAESADVALVREFAGLIREGKSAGEAVHVIAEGYALEVSAVVDIITKVKKG